MSHEVPESVKRLYDNVRISRFWWDGVQINIPMHSVYATIPNPVADYYTTIYGYSVPILKLGKYRVPIWDPMRNTISKMPKFAIILIHQETDKFGLYAYPADCIDDTFDLTYSEWFERQQA